MAGREVERRPVASGILAPDVDDRGAALAARLLDDIGSGLYIVTLDGYRLRFASAQARALLNLPAPDPRGEPYERWAASWAEPDRPTLRALLDGIAAGGKPSRLIHQVTLPLGIRWLRTTLRASTWNGRPVILCLSTDVTERRASEFIFTQQETRLKLLFSQLPAVVWSVDRELRFTTGIGGGLEWLDLSQDRVLGSITLMQYFRTDDPSFPAIAAHRRALAGERVTYELSWHGRTYEAHVEPFRDDRGDIVGAIGVSLDVTRRTEAERERDRLLAAERDARRAAEEALRVREEFLSIASHELSTPLMSLQLSVQTLARAMRRGEAPPQNLVDVAEHQVRRLGRLVDELLSVSRLASGRLDPELAVLDLSELAADVVRCFEQDAARARCALTFEGAAGALVAADRSQLEQVITNLLANAVKYGAGQPVQVAVEVAAERVELRVIDHGIGVPPDRREAIFERFERAVSSRNYGGLGLGLYIARAIIARHGGTIAHRDTPGGGATFAVELPLGEAPDGAAG